MLELDFKRGNFINLLLTPDMQDVVFTLPSGNTLVAELYLGDERVYAVGFEHLDLGVV